VSSRLALGTVQFGVAYGIANQSGQVSRRDAAVILAAARASGIDTLDTAIAYGNSETYLGAAGVRGWRVVSKLPPVPDGCPSVADWVGSQLAGSLGRLKVHRLYGLLLHNPRQLLDPIGTELLLALRKAQEDGLVDRIGISIYSPDELSMIYPAFKPDLVQAPLNLIDHRLVDSGWLGRLADNGVEVHTRSSFLQGLLLMKELPLRFMPWQKLWRRWQQWLLSYPAEAATACLSYPLSHPEVARVVVGVDSLAQLTDLLCAVRDIPANNLPDLCSNDENLINPANWNLL